MNTHEDPWRNYGVTHVNGLIMLFQLQKNTC